MTTVARRDPADKAKIDAIEKKLLANPEIAKLIDDLGTSTTDANDLVRGMLQASITRGLNAEMDAHLGYESGDRSAKAAAGTDNHRNGSYPKTVDSHYGPVTIDIPRDRAGTFLPTMVPKGSRRLTDVDDMIVSLYAGGRARTKPRTLHHWFVGIRIAHDVGVAAVLIHFALAFSFLIGGVSGVDGVPNNGVQRRIGPRLCIRNRLFFLSRFSTPSVALFDHGVLVPRRSRNVWQARLIRAGQGACDITHGITAFDSTVDTEYSLRLSGNNLTC